MTDRPEITGDIIKLDYATLRDTKYVDCKLIFAGGRPPVMQNCDFIECEFILEGPAQSTLHFLESLAHSGGAELVVKGMLGLVNWKPSDG